MKFSFHQKKKKKKNYLFHQSNSLFLSLKRKERENSNIDLQRRAEARWSAISSLPHLRPITGICLTLFVSREKKIEFVYPEIYLVDRSIQ